MSDSTNSPKTIRRVLIANRGEIACRVIATLRRLRIESVAVYSDADAGAQHVRDADIAVRIGPAPAIESYLRIDAVVDAAVRAGADAVHPGYGFLSENQQFAAALDAAGIVFLGPPASAIATMGDKISARAAVVERGVPVVPGLSRPGLTDDELIAAAPEIGFPVLIKPSAGGGGKGMHRVETADALPAALITARREAAAAFGDDTLFVEHFVDTPRHIEVQVLADRHGNVIHLGERECSLQRRHQKVIEEAPSALLDAQTRARIGQAACDAARSVAYVGAGTVEFIVSAKHPDAFFFMEMNTRLQVEHPVTEMVTGVDLVEQQIRVAAGEPLALSQNDITLTGHAVEARVYAEDPASGFLPTGGTIVSVRHPVPPNQPQAGPVRADSAMRDGLVVGSDYDPMLAKIIAYGDDRATALARLDAALAQTHVLGVGTNIDFCRFVLRRPEVAAGTLDTELLDRLVVDYAAPATDPAAVARVALHHVGQDTPRAATDGLWRTAVGWRIGEPAALTHTVTDGTRTYVSSLVPGAGITIRSEGESDWAANVSATSTTLTVDGLTQGWSLAVDEDDANWVAGPGGTWVLRPLHVLADAADAEHAGDINSPMPGTVVAVSAADGADVTAGSVVVVVEAMKMEHALKAPADGVVAVKVAVGDKVKANQLLAHVAPAVQPEEA
ncbi:ATP-grasp domain-containing protein [Gordonia sp. TBRC 11910]|uniref:biotin carboxylase n=1 Tax=Gordonia asplenii TaxID=2725283 RepID=A0A848KRG3_9ACTN|nr:biotin carboxylase N-terminal domain-containing protein [Gordonia asplenii]NMO00517.1 ATP-grasp domain-containing protein [Gordonia asplenii]